MRERGLGAEAINVFEHYYRQLEEGALGLVPEETIEPWSPLTTSRRMRSSATSSEMLRPPIVI